MVTDQKKRGFGLKWFIIGALLGAGIYYGPGLIKGGPTGAPQGGPVAAVSTAAVISKPVTQWREFSGIFEAVRATEIRPQVSGQITAIHFADGEQVKKGDPLFTIDTRPYEAALTSTKGAFVQAKAALARANKLVKSKAISAAELEQAQSAYDQALGAYQTAQVNLGYCTIRAPISGKVSRAEITEGNIVDAGQSAPLLASVVSVSPIYASFDIDEQTYLKTIQGVPAAKLKTIPVEVGLSSDTGTPLKARIHSFDNQITPGSGTIRVRATLENTDATLLPGLFARVRIGTADEGEAILINPAAVGTDQSKKFVMVVGEGNKAEYREVKLGSMADGLQIINEGLKAGEQIIVNGLQRVQPGAPIQGTPVDMLTLAPLNPPATEAPAEGAAPAATSEPAPVDEKKP
jgi:membrane fusion protein, multidrug efflux system